MIKRSAPAGKFGFPTGALCCFLRGWDLHDLRHEVPHGLGCLVLFLAGGVGVGSQSESCVVVAQHGGDGFDVHAVLKSQGGEGVPEIRQMFINTKTERYKKPGSHRKKEFL